MSDLPIHPPAEAPERPHAEKSASKLKSLALCPGYKPDKKPKKEQHWVTQQGIRGHDALEKGDSGELQSDYEGKLVQLCEDYVNALPEAHADLKEQRVETIEGRWGYFDRLRFRLEGVTPDQVDIESRTIYPGSPTIADLVDYKFVKVKEPEDAEINLQGMDYVTGLFDQYPSLQTIHVHFLAPRFGTVTTGTFTRSDVPRLKLEIFAILTQAKRTDKKRVAKALLRPHYETCRVCDARATCKAIQGIAQTVYDRYTAAGHANPLPEVPQNVHASEATEPEVLGKLKTLSTVLGSWSEAVDHHCLSKALDDGIVPTGYAIGHRKGKRKVSNPLALLTIGPKFGLEVADVLENSTVSIAKLEDVVMERALHGQKAKRQGEFIDALYDASALERGDESPTLIKTNK